MRIAAVSDIHGNLTAFQAVLADLRDAAPDLILHGGDLADSGSAPCDIIDQIRALGWPGVLGNTDEMLFAPATLAPHVPPQVRDIAEDTRARLGEDRLAWLAGLPRIYRLHELALVHAAPDSCWRIGEPAEYHALGRPLAVHGHTHAAAIAGMIVDTGSVSLSFDGDPRAAYALIDNGVPSIRRVAYDRDREAAALRRAGIPHAEWIASLLLS